ncbi:uncharacterized protein K444DRAFT_618264 [Hyaloscypha bicolor E]|uniref:Secreted protein n=1 Tax=Hyaloscypha bicolor E TaxID=1095630 RepID=A0A2J6SUL0_9HELO|nr:uncharacterized protein K444DRAFT_618264 [Hyaloscypha bicolor E]PMD54449.1 hypothetical protein K444DRAFT_618264 [Hyaloscypha bicolor E]
MTKIACCAIMLFCLFQVLASASQQRPLSPPADVDSIDNVESLDSLLQLAAQRALNSQHLPSDNILHEVVLGHRLHRHIESTELPVRDGPLDQSPPRTQLHLHPLHVAVHEQVLLQ